MVLVLGFGGFAGITGQALDKLPPLQASTQRPASNRDGALGFWQKLHPEGPRTQIIGF